MTDWSTSNIHLIAAAAQGDLKKVEKLIAQGADLEARDDWGQTALLATMRHMHIGAGKWFPEKMACAKVLLSAGADPKACDKWGHDVMHHAIDCHCSELVRTLRESGFKILDSYTLLELIDQWPRRVFSSVIEECEDILRMMLEEKPDLNQRADERLQRTPLLLACNRGHYSAIEILLSAEADPTCVDSEGTGPLPYLANYAWRSRSDCLFTFYLIIRFGADVNNLGYGPEGDTALGWLAKYGGNHLHNVVLLLENGADPNLPNNRGETPLMHAANSDRPDLLQTLLMFGADPNSKDKNGMTVLDHAKNQNRLNAIRVLEKNRGDAQERGVQVVEKAFRRLR
jgi:ankyrin repeat protein